MINEMADYRKKFHQTYHTKILPMLNGFEIKRQKGLLKLVLWELLYVALFAISCANYDLLRELSITICVLVIIAMIFTFGKIAHDFAQELKKYCLYSILHVFGNISPKADAITNSDLSRSDLFAMFNRRSVDDSFSGVFNGVEFAISETDLAYESGSGKNKSYRHIFHGVVIKFKSNKPIRNKTIVTTKGDMNTKRATFLTVLVPMLPSVAWVLFEGKYGWLIALGILVGIYLLFVILGKLDKKEEKLKKITLEDPLFEKKFNAYSSDEIEGRYLLTTAFMERFLNMKTNFGARKAKCSFYGDSIMFAISTRKNLFELGNLFTKMDNPKHMDAFFNEMSSVLALIDYFKLNKYIGL